MPFKDDPLNGNNSSEILNRGENHQGDEPIEILLPYLVKSSHRSK